MEAVKAKDAELDRNLADKINQLQNRIHLLEKNF